MKEKNYDYKKKNDFVRTKKDCRQKLRLKKKKQKKSKNDNKIKNIFVNSSLFNFFNLDENYLYIVTKIWPSIN